MKKNDFYPVYHERLKKWIYTSRRQKSFAQNGPGSVAPTQKMAMAPPQMAGKLLLDILLHEVAPKLLFHGTYYISKMWNSVQFS